MKLCSPAAFPQPCRACLSCAVYPYRTPASSPASFSHRLKPSPNQTLTHTFIRTGDHRPLAAGCPGALVPTAWVLRVVLDLWDHRGQRHPLGPCSPPNSTSTAVSNSLVCGSLEFVRTTLPKFISTLPSSVPLLSPSRSRSLLSFSSHPRVDYLQKSNFRFALLTLLTLPCAKSSFRAGILRRSSCRQQTLGRLLRKNPTRTPNRLRCISFICSNHLIDRIN